MERGRFVPPENQPEIQKEFTPAPTRREFLKSAVATAGLLAMSSPASAAGEEPPRERKTVFDARREKLRKIAELNKEFGDKMRECYEAQIFVFEMRKRVYKKYGDLKMRLPDVKDQIKKEVSEEFEKFGRVEASIKTLVEVARRYAALSEEEKLEINFSFTGSDGSRVDKEHIQYIFEFNQKYLSDVESYGVFFRVLQEMGVGLAEYDSLTDADEYYRKLFTDDWPAQCKESAYSAIRAVDFIPRSNDLDDQKIDPRDIEVGGRHLTGLSQRTPWLNESRNRAFRKIIDLEGVRELFQETDCTLSEVFSIIKALIRWSETEKFDLGFDPSSKSVGYDERLIEEKVTKGVSALLQEREIGRKEEILGRDTDTVITIESPEWPEEKKMMYDIVKTLAPRAKHLKIEGKVDAAGESDRLFRMFLPVRGEAKEEKGTKERIYEAIRDSRGKTTIFLNVHGSEGGIVHSGDTGGDHKWISMTPEELAYALYARVLERGGHNTLHDVKIMMTNCYSADFTDRVVARLTELLTKDESAKGNHDSKISLPGIITGAQRSNLSTFRMVRRIAELLPVLKKEKRLTEEVLMRDVQPLLYDSHDMTFFANYSFGGYGEIGQNDATAEDQAATVA